jgi:transcription factor S
MFCPKCGSIMTPKKEKGKNSLVCSCGYTNKKAEKIELKEEIKEIKEIEAIEEEVEIYPLVESDECAKCGHKKAYFWEIQTRASDEPATKFLKCQKCKHIWRDYK